MFLERLSRIANRVEGVVALSLVGSDGIAVESVNSDPDLDLEALAAELITQVEAISDDHRELDVGDVEQFTVVTDRLTLIISSVSAGYYLLCVMKGRGTPGRARFELKRAKLAFEDDLI